MIWQDTPHTLLLIFVAAISAVSGIWVWGHLSVRGARTLALILLTCAAWCIGYALELGSTTLSIKLFWVKLQYISITTVPLALFLFTARFSGHEQWLTSRKLAMLSLVPMISISLVFTNEQHQLFWTSASLVDTGSFTAVVFDRGMWFWVHTLYSYIMGCGVILLLVQLLLQSVHLYRWQATALLFLGLVPWFGNLLYLSNVNPFPHFDITPPTLALATLLFSWSVSWLRMGDILAVSRDAIIEGMGDAVIVLDSQDRVVSINPAVEAVFERTAREMVGRSIRETLPELWSGDSGYAAASGTRKEITLSGANGPRFYDARLSPIQDWQGHLVSQVIVLRDITDRKRLEEQLLRAQRMETAGRIAGQVAHDFNNLLAPLIAYPDLIKAQLPESHPAVPFCDAMQEAADRMVAINEDMMALGRRGHFDQQVVNLNQLVKDAVDQMIDTPETLKISLHLCDDLLSISGSPAQLLRVIVNLISNAREAMQDDGLITIRTENVYVDRPFGEIEPIPIGEYVRLQLQDTGSGISAEIRSRIFDAFFTTKKTRRRGCGLGLSIIQAIVGDHKGYLDLESEVGKGTTFSVYLPICRDAPEVKPEWELRGGSETLLVVDDDRLQRDVTRQLLERLGYRVVEAASGGEALAYLAENPVDLILLDMIMPPGIDGTETYRRALEIRPNTPAIIVSGFAESERVREAQRLGAGAYIRKPVNQERLARATRDALDGAVVTLS
ncbi:MAG: histidine kinase N-terminal 7TM domain-containing protein [Chloroflexota bacterium]|jgi:two-component system cell cycle sensor histidine kinase/response regulator CckA